MRQPSKTILGLLNLRVAKRSQPKENYSIKLCHHSVNELEQLQNRRNRLRSTKTLENCGNKRSIHAKISLLETELVTMNCSITELSPEWTRTTPKWADLLFRYLTYQIKSRRRIKMIRTRPAGGTSSYRLLDTVVSPRAATPWKSPPLQLLAYSLTLRTRELVEVYGIHTKTTAPPPSRDLHRW
jgi:hypothetical protein